MNNLQKKLLLLALLLSVEALAFTPSRTLTAVKRSARRRKDSDGRIIKSRFQRQSVTQPPGPQSKKQSYVSLHAFSPTASTVALAVCHVVGGSLAAPIVSKAITGWYRKISLPTWTPPDRVFAPVWTILYSCMGVSVARVIQRLPVGTVLWRDPGIALWIVHYLLNLSWAPVFFGAKRLRLGLLVNCLLVISLLAIIPRFAANNLSSGLLLLPYLAWLNYATVLNWAICKLNPTVDGYNDAMFQSDLYTLQQNAATYAGV